MPTDLDVWNARSTPTFPPLDTILWPANGPSPLMMAAQEYAMGTALALLQWPGFVPDVAEQTATGQSLLNVLLTKAHGVNADVQEKVFERLLNVGANPWAIDSSGMCPLRQAAMIPNAAFFNAYVRSPWHQEGWMDPPAAPADRGQLSFDAWEKSLRRAQAPVVIALTHADAVSSITALVNGGVPMDARDADGNTALHVAQGSSMINALVQGGADLLAENDAGQTVHQVLSFHDSTTNHPRRAQTLHQWTLAAHGSTMDSHSARVTALLARIAAGDGATFDDKKSFAKFWKRSDAALVNHPSPDGRLLLPQAVLASDIDAAARLLEHGADVHAIDDSGCHAVALSLNLKKMSTVEKKMCHTLWGHALKAQWQDLVEATPDRSVFDLINNGWGDLPLSAWARAHEVGGMLVRQLNPYERNAAYVMGLWWGQAPKMIDHFTTDFFDGLKKDQPNVRWSDLARAWSHHITLGGMAYLAPRIEAHVQSANFKVQPYRGNPITLNLKSVAPELAKTLAERMLPSLLMNHAIGAPLPLEWLETCETWVPLARSSVVQALVDSSAFTHPEIVTRWSTKAPGLFAECEALSLMNMAKTISMEASSPHRARL